MNNDKQKQSWYKPVEYHTKFSRAVEFIAQMLFLLFIGMFLFRSCTSPVEYTRCDAAKTAARKALEGEGNPIFDEGVRNSYEALTDPYCD